MLRFRGSRQAAMLHCIGHALCGPTHLPYSTSHPSVSLDLAKRRNGQRWIVPLRVLETQGQQETPGSVSGR